MTTPKLSLKRMEEYCKAATPGPWRATSGEFELHDEMDQIPPCNDGCEHCVYIAPWVPEACPWEIDGGWYMSTENADFIANARTDLPALLSWAKRARRFIESYGRWYAHVPDHYRNECTIMGYQERKYLLEEFGE